MESSTPLPIKLPKIDFSGIDTCNPGTGAWSVVREQVTEALATYGCFEAVYPKLGIELRSLILDTLIKDLFALPLETKLKNSSDMPFHGYLGQMPEFVYESLAIMNAEDPQGAQAFTSLMWPEGNANFSKGVQSFSKRLAELEQTAIKMVFEGLEVEKHYNAQRDSTKYMLRLAEYGPSNKEDEKSGLFAHRDKNTLSIVCQNQVDGLEIETKDGEWYPAVPSLDSVVVVAGDSLRARTNGRVYAPLHRILVGGNMTRYSLILFSIPKNGVVVEAPPELIDAGHPPLFKRYDYNSYERFCVSEQGMNANPQLDTFCGY